MIPVTGRPISLQDIRKVAEGAQVELAEDAKPGILASRKLIESIVSEGRIVYGVTTGFGKLSDVTIPADQLEQLQINLVRSHACGVGPALPTTEARAMMLLRANVLAKGYSGVRLAVVELLVDMLNRGVTPIIPEQGSVGASGDLAPLAHLALVVLGEGRAEFQGVQLSGSEALERAGLRPIRLAAKEGLGLLNGTQALTGVGALALAKAQNVLGAAHLAGMMTLDALRDTPAAYDAKIQDVRPHPGQVRTAAHLRGLIEGSEIRESHRYDDSRVQDAYSLRCMPQVHGAIDDVLRHVQSLVEIESGSATDNPLIFPETGEVISGGNFHGAPLAYGFDYAGIAMTDLMAISERRIERLVNSDLSEGLPPFLTKNAGLESGFMIPQVVAASLLNESKVLAHPASVDNVPTSGGKEDHVSMGMVAATKLRRIVANAARVVAIELIAAAQGLDYRAPLQTSRPLREVHAKIRSVSPAFTADRALGEDIEQVAAMVLAGKLAGV